MKTPGMGMWAQVKFFQKIVFIFFCRPQREGVMRKRLKGGRRGGMKRGFQVREQPEHRP